MELVTNIVNLKPKGASQMERIRTAEMNALSRAHHANAVLQQKIAAMQRTLDEALSHRQYSDEQLSEANRNLSDARKTISELNARVHSLTAELADAAAKRGKKDKKDWYAGGQQGESKSTVTPS